MRRTLTACGIAAALVASLVTPLSAQTIGTLELDEHEGAVGDRVTGSVDPGVVAEECPTEPSDLIPDFIAGPDYEPVDGQLGPVFEQWMSFGPLVGIEPPPDGDWPGEIVFGFPSGGMGPPPDGVPDLNWAWRIWPRNALEFGADTGWEWNRQIAAAGAVANLFALMATQAAAREAIFPEMFIFSFADIESQQPLGDMSNFNPATGESVEDPPLFVPDLEPGIWPVIATCIELDVSEENFLAAVEGVVAFMDEIDFPEDQTTQTNNAEFLEGVAVAALSHLATPGGGPWVDLYCILDDDGVCHPELRGIDIDDLTEEELEEFLEELLAEDAAEDAAAEAALAAETDPRFTG